MTMPTGNGENPQVGLYGQWTIDDCQNWLFAKIKKAKSLPAWISRIVNLKKSGYCATLNTIYGICKPWSLTIYD